MAISKERIFAIIGCLYSKQAEIIERREEPWIIYGIYVPGNAELWLSAEEVSFLENNQIIECDGGGENTRVYIVTKQAREKIDQIRTNSKRLLC